MSVDRFSPDRRERRQEAPLERLSAVVSLQGRGRDIHYLGWTQDGTAVLRSDVGNLSRQARMALDSFTASRQRPVNVPYRDVRPVSYAYGLAAIDFRDDRRRGLVAEDQLRFNITEGSMKDGERQSIHIGELDLLRAIHDAQTPFQEAGAVSATTDVADPHSMYTLILPNTTTRVRNQGLAVLFRPNSRDMSNEVAFAAFVRDVISRLILFDETAQQRGETPKGYIHAAAEFTRTRSSGDGNLGLLHGLKKAGVIDFDDEWAEQFAKRKRGAKARGIGLLKAIGIVDVDDATLRSIREPLPDYDIDVEIDTLFDVARAMENTASRVLRR